MRWKTETDYDEVGLNYGSDLIGRSLRIAFLFFIEYKFPKECNYTIMTEISSGVRQDSLC